MNEKVDDANTRMKNLINYPKWDEFFCEQCYLTNYEFSDYSEQIDNWCDRKH